MITMSAREWVGGWSSLHPAGRGIKRRGCFRDAMDVCIDKVTTDEGIGILGLTIGVRNIYAR